MDGQKLENESVEKRGGGKQKAIKRVFWVNSYLRNPPVPTSPFLFFPPSQYESDPSPTQIPLVTNSRLEARGSV